MKTLQNFTSIVKETLQERINERCYRRDQLFIHEIAEDVTPNYYFEEIEVASKDISNALNIPESCPPNNDATPMNLMTANIYEHLSNELYMELFTRRNRLKRNLHLFY